MAVGLSSPPVYSCIACGIYVFNLISRYRFKIFFCNRSRNWPKVFIWNAFQLDTAEENTVFLCCCVLSPLEFKVTVGDSNTLRIFLTSSNYPYGLPGVCSVWCWKNYPVCPPGRVNWKQTQWYRPHHTKYFKPISNRGLLCNVQYNKAQRKSLRNNRMWGGGAQLLR